VLAVVPPPHGGSQLADPLAIERHVSAERRAALDQLVREALPGQSVSVAVRSGKPYLEIIRHVLAEGHDLVIKAAEELGGPSRHFLASIDQHLLRKCPATVWLRRGSATSHPRVVLAAVDVDPETSDEPETEAALNRRILSQALAIATWAGARLHVLTAWDVPYESLLRAWAPSDQSERYLKELETYHWNRIDELASDVAGAARQQLNLHVERGSARTVIPERVRTLGAELLVMGTVARTGVPGLIIGNTAEDVLNSVDVPLVAMKPPGYVTPIRAED
jgi:nucleotide-binding universal stress UspA family protein